MIEITHHPERSHSDAHVMCRTCSEGGVVTVTAVRCGLGSEIGGAETLYEDAPYLRLMVIHKERGDEYWVYTSEHTDLDTLLDMWPLLPATARYAESEPCRFGFGRDANSCVVHYLISKKGELIESSIAPTIFFATKVMGQLR
jgi:hypothetical protein